MESSVFGTLLLRFRHFVAEREWEYSIIFTISNAHHKLWDKMSFVIIVVTFGPQLESLLVRFVYFWVFVLHCSFLSLFRGSR